MTPSVAETIRAVRQHVRDASRAGKSIGCVPTMGALHAGHGALLARARQETEFVAATLFVNPIQFDRASDYEAYARPLEADLEFCRSHGTDLVFAPSVEEMYPVPSATFVDVPELSSNLCGAFRPGHFRGVATVVVKLLQIVQPDKVYFGEKDAQQLAIIRRVVQDLNIPVEVVAVPTVREADGLAMSSRNQRLTVAERAAAPQLFRALDGAQVMIAEGCSDVATVHEHAVSMLAREPGIRLEYLEIVDPCTLAPVLVIDRPVRLAAAVWLGSTRLIDNVLAGPPSRA